MEKATPLKGRTDYITRIKKMKPFAGFSDHEIETLLDVSRIAQYDAGDFIIREDELDNQLFLLIIGRLEVLKGGQVLRILDSTGDIFGEMGIIEGKGRSASVRATKTSICLVTDASFLDKVQKSEGWFVLNQIFIDILAERLKGTSGELASMASALQKAEEENRRLRTVLEQLQSLLRGADVLFARAGAVRHGSDER